MMTLNEAKTGRSYHDAMRMAYRLEAEACETKAKACDAYAWAVRTRHPFAADENEATHNAHAASYRETAARWRRLAERAEADYQRCVNEEIRLDYYSGPPGSFTGD